MASSSHRNPKELKDFIVPDLVEIEYKTETTFDSNTIIIYLRRIIIPYMKAKSLLHILLIFDSAKCHLTSDVSAFAIKNGLRNDLVKKLSEQQIIDCSSSNNGCKGGFTYYALDYVKDNGLESFNQYPYFGNVDIFLLKFIILFKFKHN